MDKRALKSRGRAKESVSRTTPRDGQRRAGLIPTHTRCPWCGTTIPRTTSSIRQHAFDAHRVQLSEPDASDIASPARARRHPAALKSVRKAKTRYGKSKSVYARPAGLPSLGKRR